MPVKDILKKARRGDRDRGGIHVRDLLALNIQTSKDDAVLSGGGDHLILPRGGAVLVKVREGGERNERRLSRLWTRPALRDSL